MIVESDGNKKFLCEKFHTWFGQDTHKWKKNGRKIQQTLLYIWDYIYSVAWILDSKLKFKDKVMFYKTRNERQNHYKITFS